MNVKKNTAIYIDFDNVFILLEQYYEKPSQPYQYTVELFDKMKKLCSDENVMVFKAFADFSRICEVLNDLQKSQVELRHIYSCSGRKNASDIGMTIDIIKSLYTKQNADKYVIVSSDSDMLPLINELRYHGKELLVIYSDVNSKHNYSEYLNPGECKSIEELLGLAQYSPIDPQHFLKNELIDVLNDINIVINSIKERFKGKGTTGPKDLKEELWKQGKYVRYTINSYIQLLLKTQYLSEFQSGIHKKLCLNESQISREGINLNEPISKFV